LSVFRLSIVLIASLLSIDHSEGQYLKIISSLFGNHLFPQPENPLYLFQGVITYLGMGYMVLDIQRQTWNEYTPSLIKLIMYRLGLLFSQARRMLEKPPMLVMLTASNEKVSAAILVKTFYHKGIIKLTLKNIHFK
jgi:hypothetical protein